MMKLWFYIQGSAQEGPVPKSELIDLLKSGRLDQDTLVWTHYMQDWTRASEVEELQKADGAGAPPTPPHSAPPAPQDAYTAPEERQREAMFFHISGVRLVLMSIASWGLFELYWIYRNWQYLKERDGLNIRPFWRGVFSIFFIHWLMNTIHDDPQANRVVKASFSPSLLANVWLSMMFVSNILGQISFFLWPISLISFLPFLPAQKYINALNGVGTPKPPYTPWSLGQYACLAIGIFIWLGWLVILVAIVAAL